MEQFERLVRPEGFRPNQAPTIDVSPAFDQVSRSLDRNERIEQTNDRLRIERAKRAGEQIQQLGQFSETIRNFAQKRLEQAEEDKRIGELYDALNPDASDLELETEADILADGDKRIKAQERGGLARGVANERGLLTTAKANYPLFLQGYLNSNARIRLNNKDYTARELFQSTDVREIQAAIAAGQREFIRQNGLQYATKTNFVNILGNTITNTNNYIAQNSATQNFQREAKASTQDVIDNTYGLAMQRPDNVSMQEILNTSVNLLLSNNTTARNRSEALRVVGDALIQAAIDKRDESMLDEIATVTQVPGQVGTELYNQQGRAIEAARSTIRKADKIADRDQADAIKQNLYRQLQDAETPEERQALVNEAADQLRANEMFIEAASLLAESDDLTLSTDSSANEARIQRDLSLGRTFTNDTIEELVKGGFISATFGDTMRSQSQETNFSESTEVKAVLNDTTNQYKTLISRLFGLRKDPTTNNFTNEGSSLLPPEMAEELVNDFEFQLKKYLIKSARNSSIDDPLLLEQNLRKFADQYYNSVVESDSGIFSLGALTSAVASTDTDAEDLIDNQRRERVKEISKYLQNEKGSFIPPKIITDKLTKTKNWSPYFTPGEPVGLELTRNYRIGRGDVIFTKEETQNMMDAYQAGEIPPSLVRTADELGIKPFTLLEHHGNKYGITIPNLAEQLTARPEQAKIPDQFRDIKTAREGMQALMTIGFPARGAAFLAGNIQQESSWAGQRTWDDVGSEAGGLVSWRAERLQALQDKLGRPVTQISDADQLEYLKQEMMTKYPKQYAVFMNPYSTERELMEASYRFWLYGAEGARFDYARDLMK